ncbi:hypothetical protein ACHAXT_011380 [Thalassiosira profunda]
MAIRVLVTGFGPYGNTAINPSLAVVKNLQAAPKSDDDDNHVEIIARQVSSEFNTCIKETCGFIEKLKPDAVIMLGEYPGRSMITVERVAINYNDATRYGLKDEAGYAPQGTPVVEGGPDAYFSTLPLRRIVTDLRGKGIPADISDAAGTLMCNHLLYGALHHVHTTANGTEDRKIPVGWVHLPSLPEVAALEDNLGMPSMTAELSTRAVRCVIESIARNAAAGGGDIDVPVKSRLLV